MCISITWLLSDKTQYSAQSRKGPQSTRRADQTLQVSNTCDAPNIGLILMLASTRCVPRVCGPGPEEKARLSGEYLPDHVAFENRGILFFTGRHQRLLHCLCADAGAGDILQNINPIDHSVTPSLTAIPVNNHQQNIALAYANSFLQYTRPLHALVKIRPRNLVRIFESPNRILAVHLRKHIVGRPDYHDDVL